MGKHRIRNANKQDAVINYDIHTKSVRATCVKSYSKTQIDAGLEKRRPEGYYYGWILCELTLKNVNARGFFPAKLQSLRLRCTKLTQIDIAH